jgi:hypothetical protein
MAADIPGRRRIVHAVTSARSGTGKTLYARLLTAFLAEKRGTPLVFDTDIPEGNLALFADSHARVVDLGRVEGQMGLFDTLLGTPFDDAVIDLTRPAAQVFERLGAELGLFSAQGPGNLLFVIHMLVDASTKSVETAWRLKHLNIAGRLVAVENRFVFDPEKEHYPETWWAVEPFATIGIPSLPVIGQSVLARPDYGFIGFRQRAWSTGSLVFDHTLNRLLEVMFEQFTRLDLRLTVHFGETF